jgi:hypothetical protein
MFRIVFLSVFLFQFVVIRVAAQDDGFPLKNNQPNFYGTKVTTNYQSVLAARFKHWEVIQIPSAPIAARLAENNFSLKIGLQINTTISFNLYLEPSAMVADDYLLTTQTPQGKITTKPRLNYFYKGTVQNTAGSDVRLCIKEGFIYGYIRTGGKEYFIEPLNRYSKNALKDEFVFYESTNVITTTLSCGFNDAQAATKNVLDKPIQNQRPVSPDSVGNPICKKVKFLIASDYSMYKSFNNDIDALETFLIANLNMAEGLFKTLNLDSTKSGDVGNDLLKFEVTQVHTSICDSCDFMGNSDQFTDIDVAFARWIEANTGDDKYSVINQFWSTRELRGGFNGYLGLAFGGFSSRCSNVTGNLIKYFTQAPITLRLQVAHEAGHSLGCPHDNEVSVSVKTFIMNTGGTYSPTGRFSRLSDFGGINYSSQQRMAKTALESPCIEQCLAQACDSITALKIKYYNSSDSMNVSWIGSGNYLVKYKVKDSINFDPVNQFTVTGNDLVLKKISPCSQYTIEVQKICGPGKLGRIGSLTYASSNFQLTAEPTNIRGDRFDLKLHLDCDNCKRKEIVVNVDHHPYYFNINAFPAMVTIPNLFADGARHRLEYSGDIVNGGCQLLKFYKAPYYRQNSISIINENFDSCQLPATWKDSLVRKAPSNEAAWKWGTSKLLGNFTASGESRMYPGNFDSTCMLFNYGGSGGEALILPIRGISGYKNVYLSFDYQFVLYKPLSITNNLDAYFKIQVYNGFNWQDIFERRKPDVFLPRHRNLIWDSIPSRIFIPLDQFANNKFQVRFIVEDGAIINAGTGTLERTLPFLFLDNIKIDGYDKNAGNFNSSFSIFPNPTGNDVFIKMAPLPVDNIQYKLVDVLGRVLQQGPLNYYRINTSMLAKATYFLSLYTANQQLGSTQRFIKN